MEIDWSKPWDFLDKELQMITQGSNHGTRFVDKLVRVHLKNGYEKWLLIHIEIQGTKDPDFSKRMFVYYYRSFDKFGIHPFSCAILMDNTLTWRPNEYSHYQLGCKLQFEFPILKLLDLEIRREDLERSKNPFSCILIAQLDALKLKTRPIEERYQYKITQTKKLYKKGFTAVTIRRLYQFIDGLIRLPEDFEIQFKNDIYKFEENKQMAYVSTIERFGIEKGLQQGLQQAELKIRQIALRMISKNISLAEISELTGLSEAELFSMQQQCKTSV